MSELSDAGCDCEEGATDCTCFESDTDTSDDDDTCSECSTETECMNCYESETEENTSIHKPLFDYIECYRGTDVETSNGLCERILGSPVSWIGHRYIFHSYDRRSREMVAYVFMGKFHMLCVACWEAGLFGEPVENENFHYFGEQASQRYWYTANDDAVDIPCNSDCYCGCP